MLPAELGTAVTANILVDGFELDLYFADRLLNIELDGPTSNLPKAVWYDQHRDAYLRDRHGIRTIRVKLMGRSIKAVVEEVVEAYQRAC